MNFYKRKNVIMTANIIISVLSALGIAHLLSASNLVSAVALIAFPALYLLEKEVNLRFKFDTSFAAFSFIFSGALFLGRIAQGNIDFSLITPIYLLFVAKAVYNAALLIYDKTSNFVLKDCKADNSVKFFFICYGIIFACWLPYFIASYPGVLTYDAIKQINMALGNIPLTDHHPVLHTMLIKLFMAIGGGSPALYVIFQMLALSGVFAFAVTYLRSKGVMSKIFIGITITYFALNPLHAVYSINIQKDTLFAAAVTLLTIVLCETVLSKGDALKQPKWLVLLFVSLLLTVFLRNNGPYVVIILAPVMLWGYKKYLKQLIAVFLVVFIALFVVKNAVYPALNIEKGSFAESVAIPLQQISRVVYDEKELTI